jgi:hypothetical protein
MTDHAKLSASGAHRWIACPGSVKAEEGIPEQTSSFAEEGTLAHSVAEALLTGKTAPEFDFLEPVQQYVDYVRLVSHGNELFVETRVDFSPWAPDGFGTADAITIDPITGIIHIIDLKFGKGLRVDAEHNPQGMLYALGVLNDFEWALDGITKVMLHIHQPRLDHVSVWEVSIDDLRAWGEYVKERAALALTDDAPRIPGEKQCQWCKAKATCPALAKLVQGTIIEDFDGLENPIAMTDEQIRTALENKRLILSWFDAIEAHVTKRLNDGTGFAGFKLVEGRSLRQWRDTDEAGDKLVSLLGEDKAYERSVLSPAKAEKALGKKNFAKVSDLITIPPGKPTLVPESDKRPAIGISVADFD